MSGAIEQDNFAAAFENLSKLGDNPIPADLLAPVEDVKKEEEPPKEPTEAAPVESKEEAPTEEVKEETQAEEVKEEAKPPAATLDDVVATLQRIAEPPKLEPKAEPAPTQTQPQPQPEPEIYTDEEKGILSKYEEEWGDVSRAEALKRRAEYRDIMNYVFAQVAQTLTPFAETVRILSERAHHRDLAEAAPDYDELREKVIEWAGNQPAYLQAAYKNVIEKGTAEEIKDLVERYRKDVGAVATPTPAPAPKAKKDTELPPEAKQAAAALAPVRSKRSVVAAGDDPSDFEGAFANFAKDFG